MVSSPLKHFQQKCEAVLRPELRKNKKIERFRDSKKSGNALEHDAEKCHRFSDDIMLYLFDPSTG
ncbi:hypothetical protein DQ393_02930 [Rhizobium tropici]|uniref:Uncharacterized protein n=1 Tax=Rhizobium tropici TaxID=398 RepID=A0A329YKT1_RHITR|nr:hypothetical protein DQ393_02930 [Rhizobium tropici]